MKPKETLAEEVKKRELLSEKLNRCVPMEQININKHYEIIIKSKYFFSKPLGGAVTIVPKSEQVTKKIDLKLKKKI